MIEILFEVVLRMVVELWPLYVLLRNSPYIDMREERQAHAHTRRLNTPRLEIIEMGSV